VPLWEFQHAVPLHAAVTAQVPLLQLAVAAPTPELHAPVHAALVKAGRAQLVKDPPAGAEGSARHFVGSENTIHIQFDMMSVAVLPVVACMPTAGAHDYTAQ
jgi:hypothetical protein